MEGTVREKALRHVGTTSRPVWLHGRVPWGDTMGEGIGKERNDRQGGHISWAEAFASQP